MINEPNAFEDDPLDDELKDDTDITDEELLLLDNAAGDEDDESFQRARLDDTDEDGTPLEEESTTSAADGSDLDIPGAELDDTDEAIGEEDEENNEYSLGDN